MHVYLEKRFLPGKNGIDREKTGRYGQEKEMHKGPQIMPAENLESQIMLYPLHHAEPLC